MWQQSDCGIQNASKDNPTGCLNDLYPFVMTTYGGPTADHGDGLPELFQRHVIEQDDVRAGIRRLRHLFERVRFDFHLQRRETFARALH